MRSVCVLIPAALLAGTVAYVAEAKITRNDDPETHRLSWNARHHYSKPNKRDIAGKRLSKAGSRKPLSLASARPELAFEIRRKIPDISPATETARVASAEPPIVTPPIEAAKDPVVAPEVLNIASMPLTRTLRSGPREIGRPFKLARRPISQFRIKPNETNDTAFVLDIVRELAPSYGVPTWFALRIASVESGFDPYTRGLAGEIGVYQLKCETAQIMGFAGKCDELTDARTNVRWGLRHLSLAIGSSNGDLHLAASKHNGGLGRTSLVNTYIAKVF